ncbi:isochorismatase family protein [Streptomyces lavenduligriseus]|nr:isochorismatase family protein [Streptomyces lavenduligriseus]
MKWLHKVIGEIQQGARVSGVPVVFLQHNGEASYRVETGTPGGEIHAAIVPAPGDIVLAENSAGGYYGTDETVRTVGVDHVVVTGYATDLCFGTTYRRGISMGYDMTLVPDGHFTPDGGPPSFPAPEVRIQWSNHVLPKAGNTDRTSQVKPAQEVRFT